MQSAKELVLVVWFWDCVMDNWICGGYKVNWGHEKDINVQIFLILHRFWGPQPSQVWRAVTMLYWIFYALVVVGFLRLYKQLEQWMHKKFWWMWGQCESFD